MKSLKKKACAGVIALAATASVAFAQGGGPGSGYSGCPGEEYGPGTMGGYGMMGGPGTMGGYGMMGGPGMTGGSGMMGGYGPGMMARYNALNLSDQQRSQINLIQDQLRKRHVELMPKMQEESIRLRDMLASDRPDPAAVGQQQMRVADLRRQMLELSVDARNRIDALLTNEQRAQLRSYRPRWAPGSGAAPTSPGAQTGSQ